MSVEPRGLLVGKPAGTKSQRVVKGKPQGGTDGAECASRKYFLAFVGDRTKTDTGGWEEDSQAREITLVKELGKLST